MTNDCWRSTANEVSNAFQHIRIQQHAAQDQKLMIWSKVSHLQNADLRFSASPFRPPLSVYTHDSCPVQHSLCWCELLDDRNTLKKPIWCKLIKKCHWRNSKESGCMAGMLAHLNGITLACLHAVDRILPAGSWQSGCWYHLKATGRTAGLFPPVSAASSDLIEAGLKDPVETVDNTCRQALSPPPTPLQQQAASAASGDISNNRDCHLDDY